MPQASSSLSTFLAPLSRWNKPARRGAVVLAIVVTAAYAIVGARYFGSIFSMSDVGWYLRMAAGDSHSVMQPFASRQLGPAVVRVLARLLHWPVQSAFLLQGVVSLIVVLATVYALIVRSAAPRWVLVAVALVPFWPQLFVGLVLPDLWYAAMVSIFLLLLWRKHFLIAACMMFPLMVSRESTSLLLVCLLIAGWRPLRWPGRLLALGTALAGTLLVQHLTAHNPGNFERLPESVYILSKVPWNFLRNILGIVPWSNVNTFMCPVPIWQHSLHLGSIHAVGVCGFSISQPAAVLDAALTTFGLLPLLGAFLWWRTRSHKGRSVFLRFCLLYGGISLLLAPMLGAWASRLFGYGWPFCLIAVPLLFNDLGELYGEALASKRAVAGLGFLGLHLVACRLDFENLDLPMIAFILGLYLAGFGLLRWWLGPPVRDVGNRFQSNPRNPQNDPPRMVKSS